VRTPEEGNKWLIAHQSENCGEVAYGPHIFCTRATHALADGGHWVRAFSGLDRPSREPLRPYIYTNEELFAKQWKTLKTPCSLNLKRDAFLVAPSYEVKDSAEAIDLQQKVDPQEFACFDPKKKKLTKMTEHTWASVLLAGVIHNWRRTGKIDLSKSGVITLVNLRPWVDKGLDYRCIGNCYAPVLPTGGEFHLDETVGDVMERIRKSMAKQLEDREQLKVLREPLGEALGAPLRVSNAGPARMPGFLVEGRLQEVVRNIDPADTSEWAYLVTHAAWSFGERVQYQFVLAHANKVVLSEKDVEYLQRVTIKGLKTTTMDQTVGQALGNLCPAIKSAF
jgi:hypothetical protein